MTVLAVSSTVVVNGNRCPVCGWINDPNVAVCNCATYSCKKCNKILRIGERCKCKEVKYDFVYY